MIIQIDNLRKFSLTQRRKIEVACKLGEPIFDWSYFQNEIINASYSQAQGKNGKQILKLILSGADGKDFKADGIINVSATGFFSKSNTIAATNLWSSERRFNTRYLDSAAFEYADVLGMIGHEMMHGAYGFVHRWPWPKSQSVPYIVQHIIIDSFTKYYSHSQIVAALEYDLPPSIIAFKESLTPISFRLVS